MFSQRCISQHQKRATVRHLSGRPSKIVWLSILSYELSLKDTGSLLLLFLIICLVCLFCYVWKAQLFSECLLLNQRSVLSGSVCWLMLVERIETVPLYFNFR